MNGSVVPGTHSRADPPIKVALSSSFDALPEAAKRLFGGELCASPGWYRATEAAGMPDRAQPAYVQVLGETGPLAVIPLMHVGAGLVALSTPYTLAWQPLLAPRLSIDRIRTVGSAFGRICLEHPTIRLDSFDPQAAWCQPFVKGLRDAGLAVLPFAHFGNWRADVGNDADGYFAGRPGALREAIRRRTRKFMKQDGAELCVTTGPERLDQAITAYEAVYARSWKEPEPSPEFNATLMRECALSGTLRLGILSLGATPVAVQFWVVEETRATVLKLAHDEAFKALSPGTVLTALMIRRLVDTDHVQTLDFGRGDDGYKQLWTDTRRQFGGWIVANPRRLGGLQAILRHWVGSRLKVLRAVTSGARILRSNSPSKGDNR